MTYTADPGTKIGHTHLKVSNLERSIAFYRDVIGLDVQQTYGEDAAFLSAGGYHHHIGLNTWASRGGPRPARNATGLFHVAFLYPTRQSLAKAVANVLSHGIALSGASDHGGHKPFTLMIRMATGSSFIGIALQKIGRETRPAH